MSTWHIFRKNKIEVSCLHYNLLTSFCRYVQRKQNKPECITLLKLLKTCPPLKFTYFSSSFCVYSHINIPSSLCVYSHMNIPTEYAHFHRLLRTHRFPGWVVITKAWNVCSGSELLSFGSIEKIRINSPGKKTIKTKKISYIYIWFPTDKSDI